MDKIKELKLGKYIAGLIIFVAVFVAAMILAAHNNTMLGWFVAGLAFAWLLLAIFVVYTVYRVSEVGIKATGHVNNAFDSAMAQGQIPDMEQYKELQQKLGHVFELIGTQAQEAQTALQSSDTQKVQQAVSTIADTSEMAGNLIKGNQS